MWILGPIITVHYDYNRPEAVAAARISFSAWRWFTESIRGGMVVHGNHLISVGRSIAMSLLIAAVLSCTVLAGCTTREANELTLRREFNIPRAATAVTYEATPSEPGWFGREGLKITMVFQLSGTDFNVLSRAAADSGKWQPLPISDSVLKHLAGIRTSRKARAISARESGRALPPEGSIYNPTEQQILERYKQSMPLQPRKGLYQIRTSGNDIMHAPKAVRPTLDADVNDFMLAMLDTDHHKIVIRVSTNY
jgi:hypothetical protein